MFAVSILRPLVRKHEEKHDCDRTGALLHVLARAAALAAMSDRSLRDIGLTRYDADWEASKPFWRA